MAKAPMVWQRFLPREGRGGPSGLVSGSGLVRIMCVARVACVWFCDRFMMVPTVLDGSHVHGGSGRTGVGRAIGPRRRSLCMP